MFHNKNGVLFCLCGTTCIHVFCISGGRMLGFYLDLQNITASKLKQQDVLMSTGIIENPEAPADSQHYKMKRLKQSSGTLLPTLGITFEY